MKKPSKSLNYRGVGRRKSSVARVFLSQGAGKIEVNGRTSQEYFDTDVNRSLLEIPLKLTGTDKTVDVMANVQGGGLAGQADAIKLGIARALLSLDENLKPLLKQNGLLTVDDRIKERKKYGQKAARRKFQFVKR
jgi:small subunit ribosomal protein S9